MKKKEVIIALGLFFLIVCFFLLKSQFKKRDEEVFEEETKIYEEEKTVDSYIEVYIYGEVLRSGLYKVPKTWLIIDLIKLAGTTKNANLGALNLAERLKGNKSYYIPPYNLNPTYDNSLININTASKEELMKLNGIGEKTAERIIAYRRGKPFESIEEIKKVPGIGESLYEKIRNFITV